MVSGTLRTRRDGLVANRKATACANTSGNESEGYSGRGEQPVASERSSDGQDHVRGVNGEGLSVRLRGDPKAAPLERVRVSAPGTRPLPRR
jgi:hypothetical protein